MLQLELLERGILPRRFVGKQKQIGLSLFDACALLMGFRLLSDDALPAHDYLHETRRFLQAYEIPYADSGNEILADLGKTAFSRTSQKNEALIAL